MFILSTRAHVKQNACVTGLEKFTMEIALPAVKVHHSWLKIKCKLEDLFFIWCPIQRFAMIMMPLLSSERNSCL